MKSNTVKIDVKKVRDYFEKEKLPLSSLGKQIGRSNNFLSSSLHGGQMSTYAYTLWMKTWGMPYETFLLSEDVPEQKENEQVQNDEPNDDIVSLLKEIISLQKEMIKMWR